MLQHRSFIVLFLAVLAGGLLLAPVAQSGLLGSLVTPASGFLMFPTTFVSGPAVATAGIIIP